MHTPIDDQDAPTTTIPITIGLQRSAPEVVKVRAQITAVRPPREVSKVRVRIIAPSSGAETFSETTDAMS